MTEQSLAKWETWPLWALGLSNGLNLALWYAISMIGLKAPGIFMSLPSFVGDVLPLVIVAGAIAAAISMDGVLVATLAGVRLGRSGKWTWITLIAAAVFSGLISYAIHAGEDWPWLHCAMVAVMLPYNFHLSQPKKSLHQEQNPVGSDGERLKPHFIGVCKACNGTHETLAEYSACSRRKRQITGKTIVLSPDVSVVRQQEQPTDTNGVKG
jgi:hypothetical protein